MMQNRLNIPFVILLATAIVAVWVLVLVQMGSHFQSNLIHMEAVRAVFGQRLPNVAWVHTPSLDLEDRLVMADALAVGGAVSEAQTQYRAYLEQGGSAERAILRLERVATAYRWCTQRPQDMLALASLFVDQPGSWLLLGKACESSGEYDAAVEALRTAYGFSQQNAVAFALTNVLFVQVESGQVTQPETLGTRYAEIVAVLDSIPKDTLDGRTLYQLAWSQWQLNKFDDAIASYELCTKRKSEPRFAFNCAMNLGHGYLSWLPEAQRDFTAARRYFSLAETLVYDEASRSQVDSAIKDMSS